jgi:hypothetical protein
MWYNLDPGNKFIYLVDENGNFHTPDGTNFPAVHYLESNISIYMNHGSVTYILKGDDIMLLINNLKYHNLKTAN